MVEDTDESEKLDAAVADLREGLTSELGAVGNCRLLGKSIIAAEPKDMAVSSSR